MDETYMHVSPWKGSQRYTSAVVNAEDISEFGGGPVRTNEF